MMRDAAHETALWQLLVKVRGLRVRRRLRALGDARRHERCAGAAVAERSAALARHGVERERVLAFCRHEERAAGQWRATLRTHDAQTPALRRRLDEARQAQAAARRAARTALQAWQSERLRHEDAQARWRAAAAYAGRERG